MISAVRVTDRRVYRTRDAVYGALIATVGEIVLVVLAIVPGRAEVAGCVFAPLWGRVTWRSWQLGVHVEEAGVKVSGSLFSQRVAWSDIDHFAVMPGDQDAFAANLGAVGERAAVRALGGGRPARQGQRTACGAVGHGAAWAAASRVGGATDGRAAGQDP